MLVISITALSLNENLTYYLYPNEAVEQRAEFPDGERFRLAGMIVEGTLDTSGDTYEFEVTDGAEIIEVVLTDSPPSLFSEDVPVLLEGAWSGDTFRADTAYVRHDENYEIPEEGGAYPED